MSTGTAEQTLAAPATGTRSRRGEILRFALPTSLEVVLFQLVMLVDQLFVASLGEQSFVAAGLAGQLFGLAFVVLAALGSGAAIRLARYAGAGDAEAFSVLSVQVLWLALLLAVAIAAGMGLGAGTLVRALGAEPAVVERGVLFIRLVAWSLPFMALTEVGNQVLRSRGDARSPALIGVASLVTNSVLNYALIFGVGVLPEMGLAGAGVATLIARGLGFVLVSQRLLSRRHALRVRTEHLWRFDWASMRRLVALALPMAMGQGVWMLGLLGYTKVFAALGTAELAAASAIGQLETLCLMVSFGFGMACLTLVGQELGRRDGAEAHRVAAECLRLALGVSVVTGAFVATGTLLLGMLYPHLEAGTLALASLGLLVLALLHPVKALNMVLANGVLRGGGDVRYHLACEGLMLVGIACAYALGVPLGWGFLGVLVGKACEELLKLVAFSWRYRSRRWVHELS
jgi:putative MATE family efflux protein